MASEHDLRLIEGALLGRLWPPERTVVGLRSCKWLRENLLDHAERVLFQAQRLPRGQWSVEWPKGSLNCSVCFFRHKQIQVHLRSRPNSVLEGVQLMDEIIQTTPHEFAVLDLRGALGLGETLELAAERAMLQRMLIRLKACTGLTRLDMGTNCTSKFLTDNLEFPPSLQHLDLRQNNIDNPSVLRFLQPSMSNLAHLDLRWNEFGDAGVQALCELLPSCPALHYLWLKGCGITSVTLLNLLLSRLPRLTHLGLGHNTLHQETAATQLRIHSSLSWLDLSYLYISSGSNASALFPDCSHLQHLDMRQYVITESSAGLLAGALEGCTSLRSLHLNGNRLGDTGMGDIAGALLQCSQLALLDVRKCRLGKWYDPLREARNQGPLRGESSLATAIAGWRGLTTLDIRDNRISPSGLRVLFEALEQCRGLRCLLVGGNQMSDAGARRLLASWRLTSSSGSPAPMEVASSAADSRASGTGMDRRAWPMLTQLDVTYSCLEREGVEAIAQIAREASELKELNMSNNSTIGEGGGGVLAEMLRQSQRLAWVDVRHCRLGMKGVREVTGAAEEVAASDSARQLKVDVRRNGAFDQT